MPKPISVMVVAGVLAIAGCPADENKRLAEQAERNLERQAAQEARNSELHREVAEATKRLVESDSAARQSMAELQRDVQAERAEMGRQRDQIESDRREIAAAKTRDPIIAESIKAVGLLLACIVPLLIAWQVLRRSDQPDESAAVAELLLNELDPASPPLLLSHNRPDSEEATASSDEQNVRRIGRS